MTTMQDNGPVRSAPHSDRNATVKGRTMFSVDQLGFIQMAETVVLAAAARGELDLDRLARETLAARGMDERGVWVGFAEARARLLPATDEEVTA